MSDGDREIEVVVIFFDGDWSMVLPIYGLVANDAS